MSDINTEKGEQEMDNIVSDIISKVDFSKITKDDVFHDIMHQTKIHALRMTVACAMLEQIFIKESVKENEEKLQEDQGS